MTRPTIDVKRIGREQQPVVIIDHCFAEPAAWRERGREAVYDVPGEFYPGTRASVPPAYFGAFGQLLGAVLRRAFGFTQAASFDRAFFSIITTPSHQLTLAQRIPHIDQASRICRQPGTWSTDNRRFHYSLMRWLRAAESP